MTAGLSTTNLANKLLDTLSNTSFAAGATTAVKLHTGDPGSAGTANASSVTTRPAITWSSAASGSKAITTTLPAWSSWAGTNGEVVSHCSVWDSTTAGNFLYSFALTVSKTMNTGDTLTLSSHSISLTPLAA